MTSPRRNIGRYSQTAEAPTHKDCVHYSEGRCSLRNMPVNPHGTDICPSFRQNIRSTTERPVGKLGKTSKEFQVKMLKLQKKMIETQLDYLDKKIKKFTEK